MVFYLLFESADLIMFEYNLLKYKPSIRIGKKGDLSDFERGMVVGARRAGRSISKTSDLLGFSCTTISRVCR